MSTSVTFADLLDQGNCYITIAGERDPSFDLVWEDMALTEAGKAHFMPLLSLPVTKTQEAANSPTGHELWYISTNGEEDLEDLLEDFLRLTAGFASPAKYHIYFCSR